MLRFSRPRFGASHQTSLGSETVSNDEIIEIDTLEIADLEYEVGGMGALEPSDGRLTHEGIFVVMVSPPR